MCTEELIQATEAINERAGMCLVVWRQCDTCQDVSPMSPRMLLPRCWSCRDAMRNARRRRRGRARRDRAD